MLLLQRAEEYLHRFQWCIDGIQATDSCEFDLSSNSPDRKYQRIVDLTQQLKKATWRFRRASV